jgi:hypothetical protein
MVSPAARKIPAPGGNGWCSAVIDLANPAPPRRGGLDPEVPTILLSLKLTGRRLLVAHTAAYEEPNAPIFLDPRPVTVPRPDASADLRCPGCVSKAHIGAYGADTLAVIDHQDGCGWLDAMLKTSGPTS